MLNDSDSELKHDVMCALISTDPSVPLNFTLVWLMLIDSDWCWLVLIAADWCWMMLIDSDWSWLQQMPIASDWCWLMLILIGNDWFLLMLINWYIYIYDCCWLMLIDADWFGFWFRALYMMMLCALVSIDPAGNLFDALHLLTLPFSVSRWLGES